MKKVIFCIGLISLLAGVLIIPGFCGAQENTYPVQKGGETYTVTYEGLVPCGRFLQINGGGEYIPCQLCHFFIMIDGIFDFVLTKIIIPVAVIMLILGGISLYFAGASPEFFQKAKAILTSAVIGLVLILSAWLLVSSILTAVGVLEWAGMDELFSVNCTIELEE